MKLFRDHAVKPWLPTVLVALWLAVAGNAALWKALLALPELGGVRGGLFFVALALVIAAAIGLLTALLTHRYTHKPVLTALLLMAAVCTYFMWTYGVVIDRSMLVNALQTDTKETLELLNLRMLGCVAVLALLPAVLLWRTPVVYAPALRQWRNNALFALMTLALVLLLVLASFQTLSSVMRNHTQLRHLITPLNALWGTVSVLKGQKGHLPLTAIGEDASLAGSTDSSGKPPLLVLVVGETARADHFALNGYAKDTTPQLSKAGVVSFSEVWSCGTNTAASVPCMFSHLGKSSFEASEARYENLLDVLQTAGLAVLWVDNQAGCKGVCERVPTVSTTHSQDPAHCGSGECRDTVMLTRLDAEIAKLPAAARAKGVVVVMHAMGSHGPAYYQRTSAVHKVFTPECTSNALNTCEQAHVVNAYDNTIVATDDFLARTIHWLKPQQNSHRTAMIYVSDHGESLGENNIYLHGLPYALAPDVQKRVPWISWLGTGSAVDAACLQSQKGQKLSHDHYFHTVLGLLGVQTLLYRPALDAYRNCTGKKT